MPSKKRGRLPAPAAIVAADEDADSSVTAEDLSKQIKRLRKTALTDFLADLDAHSVRWHYEREDRQNSALVTFVQFTHWSARDQWHAKREAYWEQIEQRVRDGIKEEVAHRRVTDLKKFEALTESLEIYLLPLRDPTTGNVVFDAAGLPTFPLKMPPMDRYVDMYLKLHARAMQLRDGVTEQAGQPISASLGDDAPPNQLMQVPELTHAKLTVADVRAMARAMLRGQDSVVATVVATEDSDADGAA